MNGVYKSSNEVKDFPFSAFIIFFCSFDHFINILPSSFLDNVKVHKDATTTIKLLTFPRKLYR